MNKRYIVFAFIYFTLSALFVSAQETGLNGKVLDTKSAAIGFANVGLFKAADTTLAEGTITDESGNFKLKSPEPGNYFLRVSAIGFSEINTPVFNVAAPGFSKNFGELVLKENNKILKEVKVQALRPTITMEADKMVVSVAGTALAAGNTAYDVLARAPGVFIDQEGNIQLNGRSGVTLMLDGKLTYLSARDLRTLLEGMPAENLKNIEIIANPSSKYDAEGSSGILNINLKKNEIRGINGSVYAGYRYNKLHGYSTGATLNYKTDKFNSFITVDFARRVWGREATFTRIFYGRDKTTYFDQTATEEGLRYSPNARFGTDYSLNKNHSIGFMANGSFQDTDSEFLTQTLLGNNPNQPYQGTNANNYSSGKYQNYTGNIHYVGKLDSLGTVFSTDFDIAHISNKSKARFFNYYDDLTSEKSLVQDFLSNDNPSGYDIYALKADYVKPFTNDGKLELGAKASRVISKNEQAFFINNGPEPVLDPTRSDQFNYYESIYAAYVNARKKLSKQFDAQVGLRAEQTQGLGKSISTGITSEREYLDWFPNIFVQQNITENYGLNYNYSRRIQRPNYGNLNPFIFYRDPLTYFTGNTGLRPQYTHAFALTQMFKKNYSLAFNYQLHQDVISELPFLDVANTTTIYTTGNVADGQNLSLTAIAPFKITKNWDTNNTVIVSYNEFHMEANGHKLDNSKTQYVIQSNHNMLLPQDLKLEVNLGYRSPGAWGLYLIDTQWWVNVGIKKTFMDNKLDVSLNASDLFRGQRLKFTTDIGGNVNDFDQYFLNRAINLTVRYNFSKGLKFDNKRRNSSLDELNRI